MGHKVNFFYNNHLKSQDTLHNIVTILIKVTEIRQKITLHPNK